MKTESIATKGQIATFLLKFSRRKMGMAGLLIVLFVLVISLTAPLIAPYHPTDDSDFTNRIAAPSEKHIFGTDEYGRDVFSRILYGARISTIISLGAILLSSVAGTIIGLISGYYGRWIDSLLMRIVDGIMSFPPILFAIALMAALGTNVMNIIIALSIIYTPLFARLIRGCVLSIKEKEYIQAIKVVGGSDLRLMLKHILPNCMSPLLIQITTYFAYAILAEAALSFIGLGVPQPEPSWGNVLYDGRQFMREAPWISIFPGVAIAVTVLGLNLLGDGLRDYLDPRMK
ncbi:peptide ABC transporter substrate-binding protein [Brevibacillus reuszeri]|uniref:ABC transporter permease n=1 Tax=Brevibacillus reuszeri TaxID=54915 RepID=UPI001B200143|nr:ABC transporter permease [Brevibacillus reuszeri]GIO05438.1 peptide ABC transporter substrate-binding protein [Brevibacillus reuszeri]